MTAQNTSRGKGAAASGGGDDMSNGNGRDPLARLSPKQYEVARYWSLTPLTARQIAQRMEISPATVRKHLEAVYRTMGIHSRFELICLVRDSTASMPRIVGIDPRDEGRTKLPDDD